MRVYYTKQIDRKLQILIYLALKRSAIVLESHHLTNSVEIFLSNNFSIFPIIPCCWTEVYYSIDFCYVIMITHLMNTP